MTQDSSHLLHFYDGWKPYQDLLVEAIRPLTNEQLAIRAAPQLRQLWELAAHILSARVYWFHRVLGEGSAELAPMMTWDDEGMPQRDAGSLISGFTQTWMLIEACLRRWTADDLDELKTTGNGSQVSRQWVIWHVIEHDLHHGGEFSFTLGMNGLAAPDL
ncbi:MAG TPA: DinB family protein [Nitrolancea sp.]|jgi:uncharacterized damage-inducible protein DinB|nr:DinB family protein [Nitrolancea sp.]